MEENIGMKLGQYHLLRRLARGGMSEIYLASPESSTQVCALKVVREENEEYGRRLEREVLVLKTLKHEHIIPTLDAGKQDGVWYYAMPYIEAGSLKARIARGPLTMEETGTLVTQIAEALHFLHVHGTVHRDIKPGNILVDARDHVWLADFGLTKPVEGLSNLTDASCLIGTPHYMAPELLDQPASASSDIYALGVLMYEMLTGNVPFKGRTPVAVCWKHVHEPPLPPSKLNPRISPAIEQAVLRALAKDPHTRYTTALELAEAYHQALTLPATAIKDLPFLLAQTQPVSIEVKPMQASMRARQKRGFARPLAAAVVLFALGLTSLSLISRSGPAGSAASAPQMISAPALAASAPTAQPTPAQPTPARPGPAKVLAIPKVSYTPSSPPPQSHGHGHGEGDGGGKGHGHGHGEGDGGGGGDGHGGD